MKYTISKTTLDTVAGVYGYCISDREKAVIENCMKTKGEGFDLVEVEPGAWAIHGTSYVDGDIDDMIILTRLFWALDGSRGKFRACIGRNTPDDCGLSLEMFKFRVAAGLMLLFPRKGREAASLDAFKAIKVCLDNAIVRPLTGSPFADAATVEISLEDKTEVVQATPELAARFVETPREVPALAEVIDNTIEAAPTSAPKKRRTRKAKAAAQTTLFDADAVTA